MSAGQPPLSRGLCCLHCLVNERRSPDAGGGHSESLLHSQGKAEQLCFGTGWRRQLQACRHADSVEAHRNGAPGSGTGRPATQNGVSFGVVANATHIGAADYYVWELARQGMIGICGSAGSPLMAYHGTANRSVSTAPLAIGVPAASRPPLVLDMASSVAALGKIRQALSGGAAIDADWALDEDGRPTTDPARAAILRPMAGPKGSGLALMLECLASVLGAAPILADALQQPSQRRHRQNAVILAVHVEMFRPLAEFTRDVDALIAALKGQPRMEGVSEILMPGESSARNREMRRSQSIAVKRSLLEELRTAGA